MFLRHKWFKPVSCPKSAEAVTETRLEHCNHFIWGAEKIQGSLRGTKRETHPQKYEEDKSTNQALLKTEEVYMASASRKAQPRTEDIS